MHERMLRRPPLLFALAGVAALALLVAGSATAAKRGTTLFTQTTPGSYTWTVPSGVKQVRFDVFGA